MHSMVKLVSVGCCGLALAACKGDSHDSCVEGDYYPQYVVTSLVAEVHSENTPWKEGDAALDPKLLVIELNGNKEVVITQNSKIEPKLEFSLFSKAHACSSIWPYSNQVVTGFSITSDTDYSTQYLAGEELAGVFKVDFSFTNKYPNFGENIIEFVANENTISLGMRIVPIEFPETSPLNLTLNISLDDGRVFEFSTGNIEFDFSTTSMQ